MTKKEKQRRQKNAASKRWREANRNKMRELSQTWHKANPDKNRLAGAKWRKANPEKAREASAACYRAARERQAGRPRSVLCEVCHRTGKVCFDHCHQSGEFRGWLCRKCNTILGYAEDNPKILAKLIVYIKAAHKKNGVNL